MMADEERTSRVTKAPGQFTRKERWLISISTSTGVTAIILFVAVLALLIQMNIRQTTEQQHKDESTNSWQISTENTTKIIDDLIKELAQEKRARLKLQEDFEVKTAKLAQEKKELSEEFERKILELTENMNNKENQTNNRLDWILGQNGSWYKASNGLWYKLFTEVKTHHEAESDCQRIEARLVSTGIRSQTVRREIWTNVMMSTSKYVWIGLSQPYIGLASGNDSWIWMDGAAYNESYTPWYSGEPSNYGGKEDCAHFWYETQLNDNLCDNDFAYICEKEL